MNRFGDHHALYAVLGGTASGDQAEAPATDYTDRPGPANWRRLIWLGVALVVTVFAVVILVIMTASAPLRLPSFAVDYLTVSSLSFSPASPGVLSADFSVTLAVRNPNKKADVRFGTLVAGVYYGGTVVAEAARPPMYHVALARGKRRRQGSPAGHGGGGSGDMGFRVEATCSQAFHVNGADTVRWRNVRVLCDHVPVRLDNATAPPTSGKLVGPPRSCTVK